MHARWDVAGKGEWRDNLIELTALSTGFDKLQYGTMEVSKPRLVLDQPVRWLRDAEKPAFSGALSLKAGQTRFSGGSVFPPAVLTFIVGGSGAKNLQFEGDLHGKRIGQI
ncbi:intermembrane phospholipid transport protein YdbH family protein, partial [Enterobacter cloacae]|uniref:intermembrane phospholipid transport protein YdbH family protein n=1 Tax=Enterobacter cloacae TaxID=550 RepID=UPI003F6E24E5